MSEKMKAGDSISFFVLEKQIGSGGFGSVWMVKSTEDNEFYAMKLEPVDAKRKTLNFESKILKKYQSFDHFPKLIIDGTDKGYFYLVMELCGPNLSLVSAALPNSFFEYNYIFRIADETLTAIEQLHSRGYIHRDIKPQNFVVRLKGKTPICLIDYGISKLYCDPNTGKHLEARDHVNIAGSPMFASPNNHERIEQSRRDDLYSWIYTIAHISEAGLPWLQEDGIVEIGEKKKQNPISKIVSVLGPEFVEIAKHIESLKYEDTPNYKMMHSLLNERMRKVETSQKYEWLTIQPRRKEILKLKQKKKNPLGENNFDPSCFLIELTPYIDAYGSECLLI